MKKVLAILLAASTCSPAAVLLEFVTGNSAYEVAPGASVEVPLYLRETLTDGSTSLIADNGGLFSLGLAVKRDTGFGTITGIENNAVVFDFVVDGTFTASNATLWEEQDAVLSPALPDGNGLIFAGTLTLLAPGAPNTTSTFTIADFDAITDTTVTYDGGAIDGLISTGAFTLTTVPEPSSCGLALLGGLLLTLRRRLTGWSR